MTNSWRFFKTQINTVYHSMFLINKMFSMTTWKHRADQDPFLFFIRRIVSITEFFRMNRFRIPKFLYPWRLERYYCIFHSRRFYSLYSRELCCFKRFSVEQYLIVSVFLMYSDMLVYLVDHFLYLGPYSRWNKFSFRQPSTVTSEVLSNALILMYFRNSWSVRDIYSN